MKDIIDTNLSLMLFTQENKWRNIVKFGTNKANLYDYANIGTHRVSCYTKSGCAVYFDNLGVEQIPKVIGKFISNQNIIADIFWMQAYNSIICGCFYIGFVSSFLNSK